MFINFHSFCFVLELVVQNKTIYATNFGIFNGCNYQYVQVNYGNLPGPDRIKIENFFNFPETYLLGINWQPIRNNILN